MSSTELVRAPIAIPPALRKAGVTVVEQDGVRAVMIPDGLQQSYNVVRPVSEIAATDPDWTPRIVVVNLDLQRHTYEQDKKRALTKEAILLLADAAGVKLVATRTPKDELEEGEIGYDAVAYVRRSDGTVAEWTASKAVDIAMEREMVIARCTKNGVLDKDWFRKQWYTERSNLRRKAETKAMLAAASLALQLKRGGYEQADLQRPFLIVGWSMTPQDPAVRAQRLLNAEQNLTGRTARAIAAAPELVDEPIEGDAEEEHVDEHEVEVAHQGDESTDDEAPLPGEPGDEPASEPVAGEISDEVAAAGETVLTFSKKRGQKISELDEAYLKWLATQYEPRVQDVGTHGPVVAQAVVYYRWLESQAGAS